MMMVVTMLLPVWMAMAVPVLLLACWAGAVVVLTAADVALCRALTKRPRFLIDAALCQEDNDGDKVNDRVLMLSWRALPAHP